MSQGPQVESPDGRVIAFDVTGSPSGWPVFLLHGTPGCRMGPKPRSSVLYRLGVRLISHDRPGYGDSTRYDGRTVADVAKDVKAIADALDIEHFSVVGRSGGGPHALACAALLGDQVVRTAVLVSLAPPDAVGLDWFEGMAEANTHEYSLADRDAQTLTERLRLRADRALEAPETLIDFLRTQMAGADRQSADAVAFRRLFSETYLEAFKSGPYGWVDDALALRADWGFRLEDIRGAVRIWHGTEDRFAPVSHTRWMAERIPQAEVLVQEGAAHYGAVEILPDMLGWLAGAREDLDRGRRERSARAELPTLALPPDHLERVRVDDAVHQLPIA